MRVPGQIAPAKIGVVNRFKAPQHRDPRPHQRIALGWQFANQHAGPGIRQKILRMPGQPRDQDEGPARHIGCDIGQRAIGRPVPRVRVESEQVLARLSSWRMAVPEKLGFSVI